MISRSPLPALLAFVLGSALQLQQVALFARPVYASFVLVVLVGWALIAINIRAIRRRDWARPWVTAAVCLGAFGLAFGTAGWRASVFLADALAPALEGQTLSVTGVVASMPQPSEVGLRFALDVDAAHNDAGPVRLPSRLYLSWYRGAVASAINLELQRQPADLRAGERWQLAVRLKAPHGGSNPHGFDYELWLWEQGIQATGYVRASTKDPAPQRLGSTWRHPVEAARQRVRDAVFARIDDPQLAGVIAALVVGDQNAIDRADWDVYRATGVAHLMSISGLHVTLFAWAAALLATALWRQSPRLCAGFPAQSAGLMAGLLLAAAYALFSGWGVPAQRTVLMLAAIGLLRIGGLRWPWPVVWMLACAVVVAADPWALLQPGFWLSFVAVGILFATEPAPTNATDLVASNGHLTRVWGRFRTGLREQWVITVALTPLTLLLFGQVSLVSLAANALAIPWVTLVITPLALAGVLVAPLWDLAAWGVQALGVYLALLQWFPFATVYVANFPLWTGVTGLFGCILLVMRLPLALRLMGLPLLLPVLLWQVPRPEMGQFELLAADVGQGSAVVVRTAHHGLIYDTGPRFSRESDAGHRVLVPLLRALGERVDTVILSHRDQDHTGGALAVLASQAQAALLSSIETAHELQTVRPAQRCMAGQHWQWDGVDFTVLHPQTADYEAAPAPKPNAISCVLRISTATQTALLVGDIEQPQEAALVAAGAALRADLLLVPHHGSKTSSSSAFLDAVAPRIALVQSGYRNRFGHPAAEVMARYQQRQIQVFDSPHCGAATWVSATPQTVHCQRREALRYWHHRVP
jgi:competence protein ComEC